MSPTIEKIAMGCKPDPNNYTVTHEEVINGNTIIMANYGGDTFGGEKLMVLWGIHLNRKTLDPHFMEGHPVIARFIPTEEGWELARMCAGQMYRKEQS